MHISYNLICIALLLVERDPQKRRVKPVQHHLLQIDFAGLGDSSDDSDFHIDDVQGILQRCLFCRTNSVYYLLMIVTIYMYIWWQIFLWNSEDNENNGTAFWKHIFIHGIENKCDFRYNKKFHYVARLQIIFTKESRYLLQFSNIWA